MNEVSETAIGLPRTAPKQTRRLQLIEATIDVLAEKGFSKLTISDVARKAGLSHGIVNFHFTSKDELLRETIMQMEAQYCGLMQQALTRAAGDPAASIRNRAATEFCDELSTPRIIRVWAAFRSEAPELYREISTGEDQLLFDQLVENCRQIGAVDAVLCAGIIDATLKGLIQRKLLGTLSIQDGQRIALACLHAVFPNHFPDVVSSPPAI